MKFLYFLLDIIYIHFLQICFTVGNPWRPQEACRASKVDEQERAGHKNGRGTRTGGARGQAMKDASTQGGMACFAGPGEPAPTPPPLFKSPRSNRPDPIPSPRANRPDPNPKGGRVDRGAAARQGGPYIRAREGRAAPSEYHPARRQAECRRCSNRPYPIPAA